MKACSKNYYTILEISRSASQPEVRHAFRRLALRWHPDRHQGRFAKTSAEQQFINIVEAYEVLGNPYRRREYDLLYRTPRSLTEWAEAATTATRPPSYSPKPEAHSASYAQNRSQHNASASQPSVKKIPRTVREQIQRNILFWAQKGRRRARNYSKRTFRYFESIYTAASRLLHDSAEPVARLFYPADIIQNYQESTNNRLKDYDYYFGLGFLYYKKGNYPEAVHCYKKAMRLDPHDVDVYHCLGLIRHAEGDWERARNCFTKVIEINPREVQAYYHLAKIHHRLGEMLNFDHCVFMLKQLSRRDLIYQLKQELVSVKI